MTKSELEKRTGQTILVVDDDRSVLQFLRSSLEETGFRVFIVESGEEALELLDRHNIDLVILDLRFPGSKMSGIDICREIQKTHGESRLPIIVLSGEDRRATQVNALNLGADDYVTKPFDMEVFIARIKALLRRSSQSDSPQPILVKGPFQVDTLQKRVLRNGHEVELKPTEYRIFEVLIRNTGQTLSYDTIITRAWGPNNYEANKHLIHTHVRSLRQKIEPDPTKPRFIITVHGYGYRFDIDE